MVEFDEKDAAILKKRMAARRPRPDGCPRVGDFITDNTGEMRRVSHVWWDGKCQTTRGGEFYLGERGGCDYGGSLYRGEDMEKITLTTEKAQGRIWFFHHGVWGEGRGVEAKAEFPVWKFDGVFHTI